VRDTKHRSLREPAVPFVFVPTRQPLEADRRITLSITAERGDEMALLQPIRSLVARTDARMLVSEVISLRRQIESTLLTERLLSGLAAAFGGLAMILAAVGLYGVLSHHVGRQRQAIGIRMALGASASSIRLQVMRESTGMVAAGLIVGTPLAVFAARAADSLFWDVTAGDLGTYGAAIGILVAAGLASSYLPARKASSIEPSEALRHG
jgi:putative ABC transport system permease protein